MAGALTNYITLGGSGLRVSPLCLGTMTFGLEWGWGSDVPTSQRIIDTYLDRGGNFIDTANIYTKGHSEAIIGDHIGARPSLRERVVIATKFMGNMFLGDPNGGGAGRVGLMRACEHSLRRLKTDYIDLYWMHWNDPHTPIEETMRTLDDLVRAGKVRHIGFSDTPAWRIAQAQTTARLRGWTPLCALQLEYSLLERTIEGEHIPLAREMNLGITPWSPLKGGVLSGKYKRGQNNTPGRGDWVVSHLNDRTWGVIDVLERVATKHNTSMSRVAIAWCQSKPGVTSSIIGARTLEQLNDNLAALDVTLDHDDMTALDAATKPTLNFPHDFNLGTIHNTHGGTTINGIATSRWPLSPQSDNERY
jgi:aryl-alcohol dehydrogenase-like predicted oxidoreductase